MPKHKSEDLKLQAVGYYLENDKHQQKTCKIFGCSERSLMRWVQKYQFTKHIKRKKRTYVAYKVKKICSHRKTSQETLRNQRPEH